MGAESEKLSGKVHAIQGASFNSFVVIYVLSNLFNLYAGFNSLIYSGSVVSAASDISSLTASVALPFCLCASLQELVIETRQRLNLKVLFFHFLMF
jgi:hypothetical protein